jgi:hypothetical protein
MPPLRLLPVLAVVAAVLALPLAATARPSADPARFPVLRVDGIGPLRLGMTEAEAKATGWLSGKGTGCELGGLPLPVTYKLLGMRAKPGIAGTVEFQGGKLRSMAFTKGVRTTFGVAVGISTTAAMVARGEAAGFEGVARYDDTFAGTFVALWRFGIHKMGGFAEKKVVTVIGIPYVPVCE